MSIVIAKKTKNGFIFGADSQGTCGSRKEIVKKIFKSDKEEGLYIGVVGRLRDCQILQVAENLLDVNAIRRETLDENSIISYTVPKLRELLKKEQREAVEKDGVTYWDSCIIIVYKDKAFEIDSDYTVTEVTDFKAIGSPQNFAAGSYEMLKETNSKMSDYDIVKNIIKTTIAHNEYVGYPIYVIDTSKDTDFTRIDAKITIEETTTKPKAPKKDVE